MDHKQSMQALLKGFFLIILTLAAYFPTFSAEFVWDDDTHITQNQAVKSPGGIIKLWTSPDALYYPLTSSFFWALYRIAGDNPFIFHTFNLSLHILNALLLWLLLKRIGLRYAFWGALFFALHPVQVGTVAWATELKNILAFFFFMLACLAYLRNNGLLGYKASLLFYLLSLLAKPAAIMFPFLIPLYHGFKENKISPKHFMSMIPFIVTALPVSFWTIWEQTHHSGALGQVWDLSLLQRTLIASQSFWFYLAKLIWPHPLSFIYARHVPNPSLFTEHLPLIALVAMIIALFLLRRFKPFKNAFYTLLSNLILLFPVLGFFNIYYFRFSFVADHFQYLPSVFLIVYLSALICRISFLKYFWVVFYFLFSLNSAYRFNNPERLWVRTIQAEEKAWLAHNNLANIRILQLQYPAAIDHYLRALKVNPNFTEAHLNLATALTHTKNYGEAFKHFQIVLDKDPQSAEAHNGLGVLYKATGEINEAKASFLKSLKLNPKFEAARENLKALNLAKDPT